MLNIATLKADIKNLLNECKNTDSPKDSDYFAQQLANIIDGYIKTATVTVEAGIAVATAGTAAAQTGTTTAPGTGTLS